MSTWLSTWLLSIFGGVFAGLVAIFKIYYHKPADAADDLKMPAIAPEEPGVTNPEPPKPAPQPASNLQPQAMLLTFCTALRDFEGGPGDLNYQLNNPGDCRPSPVGYFAKYQPVEIIDTDTDPRYLYHKGKFAKFPTYELGWEYLQAMIHYTAVGHPQWTILDLMTHYAPSSDKNNPTGYAAALARQCGVSVNTTLQQLFGV